ncbi:MAG: hypothetical protein WC656_01900 [Sulfurimonas sp.]
MAANVFLSVIENKRQIKNQMTENYEVCISDVSIFGDLKHIFSHIGGYKKLYIKLFEDMARFNFRTCASVTDNSHYLPSEYGHITLYQHTINTFDQMILIVKTHQDYQIQKDLYLLIALLHDFGKSHELCEHYKIELEKGHWIRSAAYFKKIVNDELDEHLNIDAASFNIIYDTLFSHHSQTKDEQKNNKFLNALELADSGARKFEKETTKGGV